MVDTDARVGSTLAGKYKIKRLLGVGSMGAVYEGTHVEIGKRVAIKLMNPEFADSPDIAQRFRREARAASAVDSDYILQVFDAGKDDELGLYMVTELLVGEDLETRLVREGRMESSLAVLIAYQASRGLAKAHGAGVIHRDLKPANLFLTTRDDESLLTKVLDFGISKLLQDENPSGRTDVSLTMAGMALGTPQYMSPEQAQAEPDIDARTDVWSLATVLYEMLAGVPAFHDRGSFFDVMMSIVREPVTPLLSVAPWVPPALAEVVHAAMVKDRALRIPDAATFGRRLMAALPAASMTNASGRFSMPELPNVAEEEEVARVLLQAAAEDAAAAEADEEIPVSVSFDSERESIPDAPSEAPPATVRQPGLYDENASTISPPAPSVSPPSSSAEDKVEIFHRGDVAKSPVGKP